MKTILKDCQKNAQGTKEDIIDTARKYFSEYNYLSVSMEDIAKKLKITKAALYYHYTGKSEIYRKVLDGVTFDLNIMMNRALNQKTSEKKLYKLIKSYLDFGIKEKNLIKFLMVKLPQTKSDESEINKHFAKFREQVVEIISPVIKEVFASKKIRKKFDNRLVTSLLTNMMDGLLLEHSFLNKRINSDKISRQIIDLIF